MCNLHVTWGYALVLSPVTCLAPMESKPQQVMGRGTLASHFCVSRHLDGRGENSQSKDDGVDGYEVEKIDTTGMISYIIGSTDLFSCSGIRHLSWHAPLTRSSRYQRPHTER